MKSATGHNVRIGGVGRRVVFVHGVGADLESWQGVIQCLGPQVQHLTYDLRGHGNSARSHVTYSLEMFVDDLRSIVDEADWTEFDLVGFSLGGLIAQRFALDHPERVRTLAVISSVGGRTEEESARVLARAETLAQSGVSAHIENSVPRWFTDEFKATHPEIVQARIARSLANDPKCYAAAYRVLATSDLIGQLHALRLPVVFMTGEQDSGSTPRMAALMADQIVGAQCIILPKLKHSVLLEAPQTIASELSFFFSGHAVA